MSSSTGVQQLALQVPEPFAVLHLSFPLGGQGRGAGGDGPCVPRTAVPVRWAVRGEARPRAEAGSRRPTEGVAETRSIFVFRSVGGASIIKFTST